MGIDNLAAVVHDGRDRQQAFGPIGIANIGAKDKPGAIFARLLREQLCLFARNFDGDAARLFQIPSIIIAGDREFVEKQHVLRARKAARIVDQVQHMLHIGAPVGCGIGRIDRNHARLHHTERPAFLGQGNSVITAIRPHIDIAMVGRGPRQCQPRLHGCRGRQPEPGAEQCPSR